MDNSIIFICNDQEVKTSIHPATSLLDFLRKHNHLTGTKEVCREGDCGACTVLVGELCNDKINYKTINSCITPIGEIHGKHIVTIEGLNCNTLSPIQKLFVEEGATQCGFCTPGFIVSLTGYLLISENFNYEDALKNLDGNICRCTGYQSIKRAVSKLENYNFDLNFENRLTKLIKANFLPKYFENIPQRLKIINLPLNKTSEITDIFIGGCTDLFVQKEDELQISKIKFLKNNPTDKNISIEDNTCVVNAYCTISEIQNSEIIQQHFTEMSRSLELFGSTQIRNSATIGGNIINASPIGDMSIILLALNANLLFRNESVKREIPLNKFYKGYKSLDKDKNELLEQILIPLPNEGSKFNFEKVSRRTYLDIASVNSALYIETADNVMKDISISAGGVSPTPTLLTDTNEFLTGKEISNSNILEAANIAGNEIKPIDDVRGSSEYKKILLHNLIIAHFVKLFDIKIQVGELL